MKTLTLKITSEPTNEPIIIETSATYLKMAWFGLINKSPNLLELLYIFD